jgi:transposase-like protein
LLIDANYYKVKDGLHYENTVLFVVAGIRNGGYCEILGIKLTDRVDFFLGRSNMINSR